jgi:hypothetical protein
MNANAHPSTWARLDPAPAPDDDPLARKPLRDVKRTIDAYLERNLNPARAKRDTVRDEADRGDENDARPKPRSETTSPETYEPVYSPPPSARRKPRSLRQALRDADRAARSASTSPSSSGAAATVDSSSSSDDDLAAFARGCRSTRLVSRVVEEWFWLARWNVASADAHFRRVSIHGVFRSWRNAVVDANVGAEIATRVGRAARRRVVSRALKSWRREAARSMAFKAKEVSWGVGALRATRRDVETMTEDMSCRDAVDEIVDRLVDDVVREGWSAVGPLSSSTPEALSLGVEEVDLGGASPASSFSSRGGETAGEEDDLGGASPAPSLSSRGGETAGESEMSFAGDTCSENVSPMDADAVADSRDAAASAVGVAVRGLLGLWRVSLYGNNVRRELPFDPLELSRAIESDEDLDAGEEDVGGEIDGSAVSRRSPIADSSSPPKMPRRVTWDAARGEAMVLLGVDDDSHDGAGLETPVYASLADYLDYVHLQASSA